MSDCSCVYSDNDGFTTDAYESNIRKARKSHRCYECGRTIEKSETYEDATMLCDGSWSRSRTCYDCISVRESLFCHGWCHGGIWEDLSNHIEYCDGKIDLNKLCELTKVAREKVCAMIERAWEHYGDNNA